MGRNKVCISESVFGSDEFLKLSPEAQSLYPQLLFSADLIGAFTTIQKVVNGVGRSMNDFQELVEAGFIFDFGNVKVIADWWNQNNHDIANYKAEKSAHFSELSRKFGDINRYKGRYVLLEDPHGLESDWNQAEPRLESDCNQTINKDNVREQNFIKPNLTNKKGISFPCPKCGKTLNAFPLHEGVIQIECPEHGLQCLDSNTGELLSI